MHYSRRDVCARQPTNQPANQPHCRSTFLERPICHAPTLPPPPRAARRSSSLPRCRPQAVWPPFPIRRVDGDRGDAVGDPAASVAVVVLAHRPVDPIAVGVLRRRILSFLSDLSESDDESLFIAL